MPQEITPLSVPDDSVETELTRRFGRPIRNSRKILAFETPGGRQFAIDRERPPYQLWIEFDFAIPAEFTYEKYEAQRPRHSGLPPRLLHQPPEGKSPKEVAVLRVDNTEALNRLLDWYEKKNSGLNRAALELCMRRFLSRFPDFLEFGFGSDAGTYFSKERHYKSTLIELTHDAIENSALESDETLGKWLLDILTGQAGAESGLLGWRTDAHLQEIRATHVAVLEKAAGALARAKDSAAGIETFIAAAWPVLSSNGADRRYSESRNVPTMLRALIYPDFDYGINTAPVSRVARELLDTSIFSNNVLTQAEYAAVRNLANDIRQIMVTEWNWKPRDLWDIQGFIWSVSDPAGAETDDDEQASVKRLELDAMANKPMNIILYGPPGTGKTYATAQKAVELCNGSAPPNRQELMPEYAKLVSDGRIEFITFHQSYSYEEFVEGLRPVQGENGSAGFSLKPEPGIFRRISKRAEMTGHASPASIRVEDRQIFKMSIGEAANPDDAYLFEEALTENCLLLGFSDIDWTDARYSDQLAIIDAYATNGHLVEGKPPTALSGNVQAIYFFRNRLRRGDIVIVSKGNSLFRAIGIVEGDYVYAPRENGRYSHRRKVKWLWSDPDGAPVSEIYSRNFMMKSIYILTDSEVNMSTLERYMASGDTPVGGSPLPFVLIIDEINRANISKVFGELITLLEPDKRIGAPSEVRLQLPYSREQFGVPANLHIIGTMNTADRSIALLDTALRRRFEFQELMPDPKQLEDASKLTGVNLVRLLGTINERVEYLFDREHQIGHAFFMTCKTKEDVDSVMRRKVIPLLAEYFYEDWSKIAVVLGDTEGSKGFLESEEIRAPAGLDGESVAESRTRWAVRWPFDPACYDRFE